MQKIINIKEVKLASIVTDEPEVEVPCGTCTFCCEKLTPHLTVEEIESGIYPLSLIEVSKAQLMETPGIGPLITMWRKPSGGCAMFVNGKCNIYDHRPRACRQFDCRKNHHPSIPDLTQK